jgi:hypothetical protein
MTENAAAPIDPTMRDRSEIEADLATLEPERLALMRMAGNGPGFVMGRLAADVADLLAALDEAKAERYRLYEIINKQKMRPGVYSIIQRARNAEHENKWLHRRLRRALDERDRARAELAALRITQLHTHPRSQPVTDDAPFNPTPPAPNNYFRSTFTESLWDLYFYAHQDDPTVPNWPGFEQWLRTGQGAQYVPDMPPPPQEPA